MKITKESLANKWGEFGDLAAFSSQRLQDGRFSVTVENGQFECLFQHGPEQRLFVLLSGARNPAVQPLIKFDRWTWRNLFPGPVLFISDPTLLLDPEQLHIGWYVGTAEHDWKLAMAALVSNVAGRLGIPTSRIVCYGSSAGGFAAMTLAAALGDATAVAINPQTDVSKYSERFVKQFCDAAFGGRSPDMLTPQERSRLSAIEAMKDASEAKCLIVQNISDKVHHRHHYTPFCKHFDVPLKGGWDPSGRIRSIVFDSDTGHGPEPKEMAPQLIAESVKMSGGADEPRTGASLQADAHAMLTLRSVRLSNQPVWIDVEHGMLEELEIHAVVKGWPANSRATALALLELDGGVTPAELKRHGIAHSSIGPYVYLDHYVADGVLNWKLKIPRGKIARIGLQLWGWKNEIFLENLSLASRGGKLKPRTADEVVALFKDVAETEEDVLAVDLLHTQHTCTEKCAAKALRWYGSMDSYQKKSLNLDLGRSDCFFPVATDAYTCVSAFHARPAMLEIPESIDIYAQRIGDKSRNMVRKAARAGYAYLPVDANQYIDDVLEIRTSAPIRQGKEIPATFHERPSFILPEQWCKYHGDAFYGVFKDGKLVAYLTLFMYGQLAQVNHFLGHADHMKEGVMNLLMYEVINDLIQNRPWVRAINYLYPGSATSASGTALFKRSMGFDARRLMMAHCDPQLGHLLDTKRRQLAEARAAEARLAAGPDKSAPKIDSAELGDALIVREHGSRAAALDSLLEAAEASAAPQRRFTFDPAGNECAAPALLEAAAVVVDGVDALNVVKFLSAGFKQFKNSVAKGAFVLFDFPADPQAGQRMPARHAAGEAPADPLQPTIDYFKRRFKSAAPGPEAVRDGFKGSDFVVKAMAAYPGAKGAAGNTVLLLKKVR